MPKNLFDNIAPADRPPALRLLHANTQHYTKGALILLPGDCLKAFGMVQEGCVEVAHVDADGELVLMAKVQKGHTFGEAIYYLGTQTQIQITALTDTDVLWMNIKNLPAHPDNPHTSLIRQLDENFKQLLCENTLALNQRIQVLSKLTLRDKILALFTQHNIRHGETLDTHMTREELSLYLGTNRSALSRELGRMQGDGLIQVDGSKIQLL